MLSQITQHASPPVQFAWDPCQPLFIDAGFPRWAASIANVGLPTLAQAFNCSFQAVQWVVIVYLLAVTTSIIAMGRLGDRMGRRRLLLDGDCSVHPGVRIVCYCAGHLAIVGGARCSRFGSGRHDGNDHGAGW
jgi:MFS family permease